MGHFRPPCESPKEEACAQVGFGGLGAESTGPHFVGWDWASQGTAECLLECLGSSSGGVLTASRPPGTPVVGEQDRTAESSKVTAMPSVGVGSSRRQTHTGHTWASVPERAHDDQIQFSYSVVSNSLWPHGLQHASSLSITNSWSLHKLMSIKSVMPSNHLILCLPLLLPSIFPSIRVFSNESVLLIRWLKYWSFSFSISPSNEYSGLISFRIDWFDLLVLKSSPAPQFKSINSSALSFLYSPTLTSIHEYWKNHSFD